MVRGLLSGWGGLPACIPGLDTSRETLTLKAGQYKYTGTMSLNIPSSPDPFPLGVHALPLGLLDRVCTQAGPMTLLERMVVQHTFIHASLINDSSASLTNFPTPAASCTGPA